MSDRSERFRSDVAGSKLLNPADEVLLDEACRLIDRLDRYEDTLRYSLDKDIAAAARLHAGELRQIMKALDLPAEAEVPREKSKFDELAARRGMTG